MDSRVKPTQNSVVAEAHNQVKEEHEIRPIAVQDTAPKIYNEDGQQLEAIQAIYRPIIAFIKLGEIYFGDTSFK